jgi:hypothetical protein
MTAVPGSRPWSIQRGHIRLRVRLTPGSSRDGIGQVLATADGPALSARVRAIPEDGKANAALEHLVARWLDVPRSAVSVASGPRSRVKSLIIAGDTEILSARLVAKCRELEGAQGKDDRR